MVEVLLQLFISKVDTELLKTVRFEILKPEYVENACIIDKLVIVKGREERNPDMYVTCMCMHSKRFYMHAQYMRVHVHVHVYMYVHKRHSTCMENMCIAH